MLVDCCQEAAVPLDCSQGSAVPVDSSQEGSDGLWLQFDGPQAAFMAFAICLHVHAVKLLNTAAAAVAADAAVSLLQSFSCE